MVARVVLVIALVVGARAAHADTDKLAQARDAIAAVHYDEAQALLVQALQAGEHSLVELSEIYRLSASTAIVLGQTDVAEQYYKRWLALVPNAKLPESVAPKLRQPFVTAQAYMAAHGRLTVTTRRRHTVDGMHQADAVDVIVEADPLGMVASVAFADDNQPLGADHAAHLSLATKDATPAVAVLDEFGNRLVELAPDEIPRIESVAETRPSATSTSPSLPLYREPLAWVVVGSVFAVTGIGFGVAARSAQDDVETIAANPASHFASDLDAARERRDRDALIANLGYAAAGACAVTAVIVWLTAPNAHVVVDPVPGGGSVSMSLSF